MAGETRTAFIPLAFGLQSKHDPRALPVDSLSICQNAQFDEEGGSQPRKPYKPLSTNVVGGGNIGNDLRRVVVDGNELLLFTRTSLYSRSVRDNGWILRDEYIAPRVTERSAFTRSDDQVFAERAELLGVAVTVWAETGSATRVFLAAEDVDTGAVLLVPTQIGAAGHTATRPHVVAQATRFLLTYYDSTGTIAYMFQVDPSNLATSIAAGNAAPTAIGILGMTGVHDVATATTGVAYIVADSGGGAHRITRVTDGFAVTAANKARTGTRVAIAVSPGNAQVFVMRFNGTTIRGDRLDPTTLADVGADVNLATPLSTTINQITAGFRSVANGGQFRCYAFWSCSETAVASSSTNFATESVYLDTGGGSGAKVIIVRRLGVASRAFDYDGRVYVWLSFAGESEASGMGQPLTFRAALQNAYFLYREEATDYLATPKAKAVPDRAGGFNGFAGHAGTVQRTDTDTYQWAGIARRIIALGENQTSYAGRSPRIVKLVLDSDEARRTAVLGRTLYVSGGLILQYDGIGLVEVGFHTAPWSFSVTSVAGALPAGSYNHKMSNSWTNGRQERERSTTVTAAATAITASQRFEFSSSGTPPNHATMKKSPRHEMSLEFWRTAIAPVAGAPFQLVTSVVPSALANPNRYLPNDATAAFMPTFQDNMVDGTLVKQESFPENAGALARLAPAPAGIVVATQDRLVLGQVGEEANRMDYSLLRGIDEVAAFNGNLQFQLPPDGGPITAMLFYAENLAVWKETALYAVPGDGFDNLGEGSNYGPARLISADIGAVSQEAVALTPLGPIFKSRKGWYLLEGWRPKYIGGPVAAFDDDVVKGITVVESQHQVRVVTDQRILVWDYEVNPEKGGAWSEWTVENGRSSTMWQGEHVVIANDAVGGDIAVLQQTEFGDGDVLEVYTIDVETAWVRLAGLVGYQRTRYVLPLGQLVSDCRVRIRLKRNYDESTYFDDAFYDPATPIGAPLQFRHGPSIQQNEALKIRISAESADFEGFPPGEAIRLTGIGIEYSVIPGLFRELPSTQRQ